MPRSTCPAPRCRPPSPELPGGDRGDRDKPLETALDGVGELESVTTSTSSGMMTAEVTWPFGKDSEEMTDAVRSAVDGVKSDLPADAEAEVLSYQMDEVPVTMFAVSGGDPATLGDRLETDLVPELRALDGSRTSRSPARTNSGLHHLPPRGCGKEERRRILRPR